MTHERGTPPKLAAHQYIHEHNSATKDEIVSDLDLEENYPLGHNGVSASVKGFAAGFRDWWYCRVLPVPN